VGRKDADAGSCAVLSVKAPYSLAGVCRLELGGGRVVRLAMRTIKVPYFEEGCETSMRYDEGILNELSSKLAPQLSIGLHRLGGGVVHSKTKSGGVAAHERPEKQRCSLLAPMPCY
jgi:hypothetical protein